MTFELVNDWCYKFGQIRREASGQEHEVWRPVQVLESTLLEVTGSGLTYKA